MSSGIDRNPPMMKGRQVVTSVNLPPADIERLDRMLRLPPVRRRRRRRRKGRLHVQPRQPEPGPSPVCQTALAGTGG